MNKEKFSRFKKLAEEYSYLESALDTLTKIEGARFLSLKIGGSGDFGTVELDFPYWLIKKEDCAIFKKRLEKELATLEKNLNLFLGS